MEKRHRKAEKDEDWRSRAIDVALNNAEGGGSPQGEAVRENNRGILVAVRQYLPDHATLTLREHAGALMRFLDAHASGYVSLLKQTHEIVNHKKEGGLRPHFGWFRVHWQDQPIEIVILPGMMEPSRLYLAGLDRRILLNFAKELVHFALLPAGRCMRFVLNNWTDAPDLDSELDRVTWDDLVLDPKLYGNLRQVIESFVPNRQLFRMMGFPWKRGVLLIGPPGTGKTMICKAAASSLSDLPYLYVGDTASQDRNNTIRNIFDRARLLAPCLLVFEDLDGLISPANRTVFLNELDGFKNNEGVFIIASSNHPGKIDEALLKRPSRFDRVFHIGLPAPAERLEYVRRLLARPEFAARLVPSLNVIGLAERVSARADGFTLAYLKEAFLSAALALTQDGLMNFDESFAEAVLTQIEDLREHLRQMKDPQALAELAGEETAIGFGRSRRSSSD